MNIRVSDYKTNIVISITVVPRYKVHRGRKEFDQKHPAKQFDGISVTLNYGNVHSNDKKITDNHIKTIKSHVCVLYVTKITIQIVRCGVRKILKFNTGSS